MLAAERAARGEPPPMRQRNLKKKRKAVIRKRNLRLKRERQARQKLLEAGRATSTLRSNAPT